MDAIDRLQLLAELPNQNCELNHGPNTRAEDFPAIDYIVMPFGYHESEVVEVVERELVIPVCGECIEGLLGEEWTLFFCIECLESQWVFRAHAKHSYRHHILWLRGCPKCTNEFGGLYFNDFKAVIDDETRLLRGEGVRRVA